MNFINFDEALQIIDCTLYDPFVFITQNGYFIHFLNKLHKPEYEIKFNNNNKKGIQSFDEVRTILKKLGYSAFHVQDDVPLD